MGTLADAWYAFLSSSLGQAFGSTSDLQNQFAQKYAGGLDAYMGSLLGRRFKSGSYYTYDDALADGTLTLGADVMVLAPFTVGKTTAFNQLSLEITAAGAGSTVDLVVYDVNTAGDPTNRLATVNVSGATVQVATGAINLTLTAGLYALGYVAHGATPPTVRTKNLSGTKWIGATTGGNANITAWTVAPETLTPPPTPITTATPASQSTAAKVMLRAA